ncbi:hypothetical protein BST30_15690 [Mycobacterium mantenii]|uniref:HTH tetR-type domain-containing protein n=1 Tax=Mycobacterium mantenii TaxID=560555 RepID=A0A1X0FTF3_MYCNT|nr:hypothetical protein BST30_15690 [Mycobacterium mantenii]
MLVKSTERIMLEDGYAAVTYRNVAAKAGVSLGAVQYHFPSLDDLFLAVVREYAERTIETMVSELRTNPDDVLRILWDSSGDEISTGLLMEFLALVNHRKSIQMEIAQFAEKYRKVQLDALTEHWEKLGLSDRDLSPAAIAFLLTCLPRWMRLEASFTMASEGHAEVRELVGQYLERAQPTADNLGGRSRTPGRSRRGLLSDFSSKGHHSMPSPTGSEAYPAAALDAAMHALQKRASLSAKALVHYTRMVRAAWAQRDGGGATGRH